jgi:phospholipase D1/2
LIVDDRVAIVGSSRICDRSLIGDRDTEIAIRIEDSMHIDVEYNGSRFSVGFLPYSVRTDLMRHHIGISDAGNIF